MNHTPPSPAPAITVLFILIFCASGVVLGQELTFNYEVSVDGFTSPSHGFGLRSDALPGLDSHDVPAPPRAPDTPFETYLSMVQPPQDLPNQWLRDFRPVGSLTDDRVELWQMTLAADAGGGTCTVNLTESLPGLAPYELNFFGTDANFVRIVPPASLSFQLSSTFQVLFWELHLADQVDAVNTSWGGVKSLYH